jgi:hypothetical protein
LTVTTSELSPPPGSAIQPGGFFRVEVLSSIARFVAIFQEQGVEIRGGDQNLTSFLRMSD